MEATTKEIIKGYLEKTERKLEVAEKLFNSADYENSVSRAYYAVFHATQALLFFAFPSLFQSGDSPLFLFPTEPMDHEKCEPVFIYFSKINRTVLFYFLDWLKTSKNDFRKEGARKGIADSTYYSSFQGNHAK